MAMSSTILYPPPPYPPEAHMRQPIPQPLPQSLPQPLLQSTTQPEPESIESIPSLSEHHRLIFRQQPERARVAGTKDKERKPIDPPPIIQLHIRGECEASNNFLQSPYYFMCCSLFSVSDDEESSPIVPAGVLTGTLVSSLHRLKDINNKDGGFFVFGDLSVRVEGEFRLMFDLFELKGAKRDQAIHIKRTSSNPFKVLPPKSFPGMAESTFMSKSFADQGVKLRIRKEPRTLLSTKRQYNHNDSYHNTSPIDQSRSPKRQAMTPHNYSQNTAIYSNHNSIHATQPMHAGHQGQTTSPYAATQQFPMSNGLIPAPWYPLK
ncbi:hypothetical protein MGYG_06837 [Nannizzia gypsea CBS 118893]|uniref:Velvet domain-containing protein n=1 Tax=Arthroderma gypseum (strain ATCC MYA-4604 / CBS 118893) TaxID=535722 RepID=E4V1C3_ARTGP|nr:hypothetical protein MGYG_06837 [Nannizzia gypsea CBS 118893]EFR03838.1 hypothetical protein MGYG_06837 [Nannizzia gypsea CBS 118893]